MGILSEIMGRGHKCKKKMKMFQTVELKVRINCNGCELKLKKALCSLSGVKSVEINRKHQKVTVTGYMEAKKVLKKMESIGKKAEIWPYVPYNRVSQPYAFAAYYDKRAPPGYVRRVDCDEGNPQIGTMAYFDQDPCVSMFSDENPNACSIM